MHLSGLRVLYFNDTVCVCVCVCLSVCLSVFFVSVCERNFCAHKCAFAYIFFCVSVCVCVLSLDLLVFRLDLDKIFAGLAKGGKGYIPRYLLWNCVLTNPALTTDEMATAVLSYGPFAKPFNPPFWFKGRPFPGAGLQLLDSKAEPSFNTLHLDLSGYRTYALEHGCRRLNGRLSQDTPSEATGDPFWRMYKKPGLFTGAGLGIVDPDRPEEVVKVCLFVFLSLSLYLFLFGFVYICVCVCRCAAVRGPSAE